MDEPVFIDSREEMEQILREEVLGYLGLAGDGPPYVVPLNYAYAAGKILFHCALTGQKLDAIRRNPHVCFTVGRQIGDVGGYMRSYPGEFADFAAAVLDGTPLAAGPETAIGELRVALAVYRSAATHRFEPVWG